MPRSPEMGFNPDENKEEPKDKKPKFKIIKKNTQAESEKKGLNIKYEDFQEVHEEPAERQPIEEWAEEMRAAAKLKRKERETAEDRARKDFKDLFKE